MFLQPRKRRMLAAHEPAAAAITTPATHASSHAAAAPIVAPSTLEGGVIHSSPTVLSGVPQLRLLGQAPVDGLPRSAAHATARASKRFHPCRVCGMLLSSTSNRTRHERAKHPVGSEHTSSSFIPTAAAASTSTRSHDEQAKLFSSSILGSAATATIPATAPMAAAGVATVMVAGSKRRADSQLEESDLYGATMTMGARLSGASPRDSPSVDDTAAAEQQLTADAAADDLETASSSGGTASEELAGSLVSPSTRYSDQQQRAGASIAGLLRREAGAQEHCSFADEELDLTMQADGGDDAEEPPAQHESFALPDDSSHRVPSDAGIEAAATTASMLPTSPLAGSAPASASTLCLKDEELQQACLPFLQWLCQPPMTQVEALIKARRVRTLAQLQPIKLNLRFVLGLLYECGTIDSFSLRALTRLSICQTLFTALTRRTVGSARVHAVFLLVKKVLVFLSTQESTRLRQFIQPSIFGSYVYVESVCGESSQRRKQESRNRALLGIGASKALHKTQPQLALQELPADAFRMPSVGNSLESRAQSSDRSSSSSSSSDSSSARSNPQSQASSIFAMAASDEIAGPIPLVSSSSPKPAAAASGLHTPAPAAAAAAAAAAASVEMGSSAEANELSSEELKRVAIGSLEFLQQAQAQYAEGQQQLQPPPLAPYFVHHLVTATLCLGLAPRSQVLRELRVGQSLVKEADGRYWVRMIAELNKNGRPTVFALPLQLTQAFDFYLEVVRPHLLQSQGGSSAHHDYVFCKKNGTAPRSDFSELTALVTQRLLGRPVNAHAFRSAVITAYYESGSTQAEMDSLASIMAHDSTTARTFYYRPQMAKAALDANERMSGVLGLRTV